MLRKIGIGILCLIIVLSFLPYLIPVTKPMAIEELPFNNSSSLLIDDVSIHYRTWLPGEDTTPRGKVLLIHGLGGSTFSWRENVAALVDAGYYVVAVDLPGFGYSDRQRGLDHSQEQRGKIMWRLTEHLASELTSKDIKVEVCDDWNLIGHSMGAGTVTAMALQKPESTNSVIFVSPAVLSMGGGGMITRFPPLLRWIQVLLRHVFIKENRLSAILSSAYGREATSDEAQGYLEPLLIPGTEGALVDVARTATPTMVSELEELRMDVGAIWGALDSWVPVEDAHRLREAIPQIDLHIIADSYHSPMETDAATFNDYLLTLLNEFCD